MRLRRLLNLVLLVTAFYQAPKVTYSECRVNARLDCRDEYGRDDRATPAWTPRSVVLRSALLNSEDVQNSSPGCLLFTTLLRHECSFIKPLQAVYADPATGVRSEIYSDEGGAKILDQLNSLPPAFQRYFSADLITDARSGALITLVRLGDAASRALQSFLKFDNHNAGLTFPARCLAGSSFEVCGVTGTCIAGKDPRVGDAITLTKTGSLGLRRATSICSEAETLRQVLGAVEEMYQNSRFDAHQRLQFEAPQLPKFSSFSKMPLLNQIDGWIQGLSMDKYGDESGKKVVAPGICLPTANAMMALALKQELPAARLGNRFDSVAPAGIANVREVNAEASSKTQLQYDHYAVHIDEMLRAGGLRWRYPTKFSDYKNFFYRNTSLTLGGPPTSSDRKPIEGVMGMNRTFAFFDRDYPNALPVQRDVEKHFKSWISKRTAFTLGLQSTASQPPSGSTEVVGHAVATQGYSGAAIIVKDPWKVASTLKFADYRYPDAGKVLASVDDPSFPECIKSIPSRCESAARSCLTTIQSVRNTSKGAINISLPNGCSYSGGAVPSYETIYSKCTQAYRCQKTINLQRPNGTYRMLTNTGATPGYVGAKSAEGFATAAYVTSYMTADPWPVVLTKDEFRDKFSSEEVVSTKGAPADCTALTQGEIVVGGQPYVFRNPIPLAKADIKITNSESPLSVGCVDLHRRRADGSIESDATNLLGTMAVTCSNNKLSVTSNQCQLLPAKKPCQVDNGTGYQFPISKPVGLSFRYDGYGECVADRCGTGFTLNPRSKTCECVFVDAITAERRQGRLSASGECLYDHGACPAGTVLNSASDEFYPSCVDTSKDIDISSHTTQTKSQLFRDAKNRSLLDFADPNSMYRFNAQGQVEWHRCRSPRREAKVTSSGDTVCEVSRDYMTAVELVLKLSAGRNGDGTCADGFILDYDKRFCVAKLTSCELFNGGLGMVTYDPEAPDRCRFMGCIDGSTPIAFNRQENGIRNREYFCGRTPPSWKVVTDDSGGERLVRTFPSGAQHPIQARTWEPPMTKAQLLTDLSSRNVSTDLDCSREKDPSARALCRLVAQGTVGDSSQTPTGASAEAINSWRMAQSVPLTTFNCGGPDTMELGQGECMEGWAEKLKTLGDCVIPNGKGTFVMGQGCVVQSCMPGFEPNPSRRACLDLTRGCYRRDVPDGAAYLAQMPDATGGGERCLLRSCPTGQSFFDEFPEAIGSTEAWSDFRRSYADYCLQTTSLDASVVTVERFNQRKEAGFPGYSLRPGMPCGPGDSPEVQEGIVNVNGGCVPMTCQRNAGINAKGVCEWYRSDDDYWKGPQYSKYVAITTTGGLSNVQNLTLRLPTLGSGSARPLCIRDTYPSMFSSLERVGFKKFEVPASGSTYYYLGGFNTDRDLGQCGSLNSNDLVVESYSVAPVTHSIPDGLGRVRFSGTSVLAELETCTPDTRRTMVARDRSRCIRPPSGADPRTLRGGYILRTIADPRAPKEFELIESKTGNVIATTTSWEYEMIPSYASQVLKSDLTYNLSMGSAPFPISAPSVVCPLNSHREGDACIHDTRPCGTIANGTKSERWQGAGYGVCTTSCLYGYHLEEGLCVANTRACTTPSGIPGTQLYADWVRGWQPCRGAKPEPTPAPTQTPRAIPTFNIFRATPNPTP